MYLVPVAWFAHVVNLRGADAPDVRAGLAASGLSLSVIAEGEEQIAARRFARFIEGAARATGEEFYGLDLGLGYDLRASGLVAYMSIACATVRDGLQNACRFGAISDTSADYDLIVSESEAFFRIETHSPQMRISRHATEFKVAIAVKACQTWVGPALRPQKVRLAVPRGEAGGAACRFGCPAHYGAEATGLVFSLEQLDLAPNSSDPYLLDLLERVAADCYARRGPWRGGTRSRVERMVLDALPKGVPTARQMAEAIGVSERTLARKLSAEGTSFSQVLDEIRRYMAMSYLDDPAFSLAQIAFLLGYADQSAFSNAFRRWTGQSPSRFRAEGADGE
ncbi:AraC-like DNA-binding protein [Amaricoccus macauensis]|uniref:AraC-like DNA-binding protein n=1 Tax=Amaricoccus macauensis TaxID=57001 RepID=A0A840SRN5_9RHOB|nr:AraC family transcriptional regulator [Amaricoccus macauensis]MBB5223430.1 AraC-like DNA-binding protein [Amaricoccus macauensis]